MTLLDIKESTKDVDFLVPDEKEYSYLIATLKKLGYKQVTGAGWKEGSSPFRFDLYPGKRIHTTDLLQSPLVEGRHIPLKEFAQLAIGVLNFEDLIASKLMRGSEVDFEDCLMLVKGKREEIDLGRLQEHYNQLISYDIAEDRIKSHWDSFERMLEKEGLIDG